MAAEQRAYTRPPPPLVSRSGEAGDAGVGMESKREQSLIHLVASDAVLDKAFYWLREKRKGFSSRADIWDLSWNWADQKEIIKERLLKNDYQFDPLRIVHCKDDQLEIWSARDTVVFKALALVLSKVFGPRISSNCYHIKSHGGVKKAIRALNNNIRNFNYVCKSDVKSYYASIDHHIAMGIFRQKTDDKTVLNLLWQYLRRTVQDGGNYREIKKGISLRCPISPLVGAMYLSRLDEMFFSKNVFYARYMDDWVILAKTKWALRHLIRKMNQVLESLKLEKAESKTFIGKIFRGFDFLGYFCKPHIFQISKHAVSRLEEHIFRLYEQGAGPSRVGKYVSRWLKWFSSGSFEGKMAQNFEKQVICTSLEVLCHLFPHRFALSIPQG